MSRMTYRDAGVDIDAGERLVQRIRGMAARTHGPQVVEGVGGFAGLFRMPQGLREPVLVSGTDGVGTKLRVAFAADRHDRIGVDLVAMCVNDILTVGAEPLFFLDYLATGRLDVERAAQVVEGIAEGCRQAGCALLGGETAEMPDSYPPGEYDLAGFAVGVVERDAVLGPQKVQAGDRLVALPSSGLHANGYSLARRVLLDRGGYALDDMPDGLGQKLVDVLLRPTRIYAEAVAAVRNLPGLHALCHVTGGGIDGNLPRVLPAACGAEVALSTIPRPAVFDLIAKVGDVDDAEMRRTFNLGVGLILVVDAGAVGTVLDALAGAGEHPVELGQVVSGPGVRYAD